MKKIKSFWILLVVLLFCFGCTPAVTPSPAPGDVTPGSTTPPEGKDTPAAEPSAAEHTLLDKDAKANAALLPRGFSETSEYVTDAARRDIVMYYAASSSVFSYTDGEKNIVDEAMWAQRLYKEYDIRLHLIRKAPETSLSAQLIAMLADANIDVLSFTPDQLPYAEGMAADLSLLLPDGAEYLNTSMYEKSKKYLMPVGVARSLWYAPSDKGADPLALSRAGAWTMDAFTAFLRERTAAGVKGVEIGELSEFLAAVGRPLLTAEGGAVTAHGQDEIILSLRQSLTRADVYTAGTEEANAPSLASGKLTMRYGAIPYWITNGKRPAVRFAPMPTADANTDGGVIASATVLALPKNGKNSQAALSAAMLFTARFADARHDTLRFEYGMDFEDWKEYFSLCNEHLIVATAPDEISSETLRALLTDVTVRNTRAALSELNASLAAYAARRNERASLWAL